MLNQTPEQLARQNIDKQLVACGWVIQDKISAYFSVGNVIAECKCDTNLFHALVSKLTLTYPITKESGYHITIAQLINLNESVVFSRIILKILSMNFKSRIIKNFLNI